MSLRHAKPVVAAFDFDGTLTRRDTLLPFLYRLAGPLGMLWRSVLLLPILLGYVLRQLPNDVAKQQVLSRFIAGMTDEALKRQGQRYARYVLPKVLRFDAMTRLAWHRQQGHRCVLISASIEHYVRPWAEANGFDEVLCTRLAVDEEGCLTGRFDGSNCYGAEKARRLRALLGRPEDYVIHAYGDSRGDREMLAMADHPWFRSMPQGGTT